MLKKAVITIRLVEESESASNEMIEVDILDALRDLRIPWMAEVEKVKVSGSGKRVKSH